MPLPGIPESYTPEFWQMISAINPELPSLLRGLSGADQPMPQPQGGLPPGVGLPGPDPAMGGAPPAFGGPAGPPMMGPPAMGPGNPAVLPFIPPGVGLPSPSPPMAGIGPINFALGPDTGAGKTRPDNPGGETRTSGDTERRPFSMTRALY